MESINLTMNYYDKIEIGKTAYTGEDLFNFLCTVLMEVISDNGLTSFDIKDLIMQINDEIQAIQIANVRP